MSDLAAIDFDPGLADPALRADPYPMYDEIRARGSIVQNPATKTWLVSGFAECSEIIRDHINFSSGRAQGPGVAFVDPDDPYETAATMLNSDPPDHTRLRGIVGRVFSARMISALEPHIQQITDELVSKWSRGEAFDIVHGLAVPLPVIVIAEMLGVESEEWPAFKRWSDDSLSSSIVAALGDSDEMKRITQSRLDLRNYFIRVIGERRKEPRDDLISKLIQANEQNVLSEHELVAFCNLLLLAGNETTTNLITASVLALARFPEQRRRLVEDPTLIPNAIEEALRFDGPVQSTFRTVLNDVEVGGRTLEKGSRVAVMLAAANRDPAQFTSPDEFDVGRKNAGSHLGFGGGIHFCVGSPQARVEGRLALEKLLERSPEYVLANAPDLRYGPSFILGGVKELLIADPVR